VLRCSKNGENRPCPSTTPQIRIGDDMQDGDRCACVGGDSNVPLGFVSATENLFMMGMGFRTFVKLAL
jgi:hypothetical protein